MFLFARRTIPANDLKELIAWLKANPNRQAPRPQYPNKQSPRPPAVP